VDAWFAQPGDPKRRVLGPAVAAALVLAAGFYGLFFPTVRGVPALLAWCAAGLLFTYLSYSVLSVIHQAWGARLGGDEPTRARIVAWREGLALVGVLTASVLPSVAGLGVTSAVFAVALAAGLWALSAAPSPLRLAATPGTAAQDAPASDVSPWRVPAFRRLMAVFLLNGVAGAVPATLLLFFINDRLQLPSWQPGFLLSYFAAGALSMPLWVRAVRRFGLAPLWGAGMMLATAGFVGAWWLGEGDGAGFLAVCVASGLALGADLALPAALLTGVIQRAGHAGTGEGRYFGWWNFATKLNLALAAGVALPLLEWAGYSPGARDAESLRALSVAYCLLPCALKLGAAALLYTLLIRPSKEPSS
jgi:glycoside/pentoside/hexuronide:cation symporter, GPH family